MGTHSNNVISQVKLPGSNTVYEIHDAKAIHDVSDLGLSAALVFKGVIDDVSDLPQGVDMPKVGDVYLVRADNSEYVCVAIDDASLEPVWERLGNIHDAASSTHTHTVSASGTADLTADGTVVAQKVTKSTKRIKATEDSRQTDTVLGNATTHNVTVTPTTAQLRAVDATYVTKNESVAVPNITANQTVMASLKTNDGIIDRGTAAAWSAKVENGTLTFSWSANVPTDVTLPTFTEVTATNTTLGTALSASKIEKQDVMVADYLDATTSTPLSVVTGVSATVGHNNNDEVAALTDIDFALTTAKESDGDYGMAIPVDTVTIVENHEYTYQGTAHGSITVTGTTSAPKN